MRTSGCTLKQYIVVLVVTQVLLRYVFMRPLMGVEELACLFGFWLYFTGATNGTRERSHIKADLLDVFIKNKRALYVSKAVVTFLTFCLAAVFVQWTFSYMQWSLRSWERSPSLGIPMIYAQASLLVNAILMLFYFFIEFVDYARQSMGHEPFRFTGSAGLPNTQNTQTAASGE